MDINKNTTEKKNFQNRIPFGPRKIVSYYPRFIKTQVSSHFFSQTLHVLANLGSLDVGVNWLPDDYVYRKFPFSSHWQAGFHLNSAMSSPTTFFHMKTLFLT